MADNHRRRQLRQRQGFDVTAKKRIFAVPENNLREIVTIDMKKVLLYFALLMGTCSLASAQDIITKKDGTDIRAKVMEVSPTEIKYYAWDNQEGPLFIVKPSDILVIRFENGANYVVDNPEKQTLEVENAFFIHHPDPVSVLSDGNLRYKDLKGVYSTSDYVYLSTPRYGLGYPWLNLIIPGLSQYCMGEPGLGTMYLLLGVGSSIITGVGYGLVGSSAISTNGGIRYEQPQFNTGTTLALIGLAANIAVTVTSIVNAYNVAKVKSLYAEDLRNYRQGYSIMVAPTVLFASAPTGLQPAPGIGLKVTF